MEAMEIDKSRPSHTSKPGCDVKAGIGGDDYRGESGMVQLGMGLAGSYRRQFRTRKRDLVSGDDKCAKTPPCRAAGQVLKL